MSYNLGTRCFGKRYLNNSFNYVILLTSTNNFNIDFIKHDLSTILAYYRRFISYGSIHVCRRMPHMLPVFQRVFNHYGDKESFFINEEEFNGRYYQATCNLQAYSASINPYHFFMTNLSKTLDGFKLLKYLNKKAPDPLFTGMFPLHACLNHDCDHNIEVRDGFMDDLVGLPGVMMVACRDIKKGTELMTTYINPQMPRNLRRSWLYKSFNFWCQCNKCKFEGDDNTFCTNCQKESQTPNGFKACGKCKKAFYCSTKCQKISWQKGHKSICIKYDEAEASHILEMNNKLRKV
ncbi:hypothetical protein LOTGIDRAFT_160845 [Lottia gigantea]|uniref:MYND-type domain-containing protein n=1 Tax=Lottia gigantea TaxID=225164 RepID=V4AN92_LOTGI|nr:hypothetical protein LOTGIDRAFT_160845 [Lottia gigantea]ESO95081.1 hypothetical protein LOTGIDRAFT_160845 [Lottia gigantea]